MSGEEIHRPFRRPGQIGIAICAIGTFKFNHFSHNNLLDWERDLDSS